MKGIRIAGMSAMMLLVAVSAGAVDQYVSTKKMSIKDHATDPTKRQIQLQSKDEVISYSNADAPDTKGMSVHLWSYRNDFCYRLLPSTELWADNGKGWKYVDPDKKNQAQISDGKLQVKIRSDVTFDLSTTEPEGTVNASVQFGDSGFRYCMHCTSGLPDDGKKFNGKDCVAAPCDAEPGNCFPSVTTTTTSTTTTTTTTTTTLAGTVVGAIATPGRMTLMLQSGLPGAETACNTSFPGSHVCKYVELQASELNSSMVNLKDTSNVTVTEFWAVDPARTTAQQCGATLDADAVRWTYATGHLGVGGDSVPLNNAAGTLGVFSPGGGANRNCSFSKWVGCCHP